MKKPTQIDQLVYMAHETAKDKGFHDDPLASFGQSIALMHSELSKALEEHRAGRAANELYVDESGKPCGVPSELADVVIRIFDVCGKHGINLNEAIDAKMAFNRKRPRMHGKRY